MLLKKSGYPETASGEEIQLAMWRSIRGERGPEAHCSYSGHLRHQTGER